MKSLQSLTLLFLLVNAGLGPVFGAGEPVTRNGLRAQTLSTWEGKYQFADEIVVNIDGLPPLHTFQFRAQSREGDLIVIGTILQNETVSVLIDADTNRKGVTPIFEGIDALPDSQGADILIRWRHPGQAGLRSVDRFRYQDGKLLKVMRADLVVQGGRRLWVRGSDVIESRPALRASETTSP